GPRPGAAAVGILAAAARLADCAADPAGTARINVVGTVALAERLLANGIFVLFISTNQVFDGRTPHVAGDTPTAPVSEYGRQKARSETALRALMARGAPAAILRLAKVISPRTALLRDWTAALAAGKQIRALHDMTMAPVAADMVAQAIEALMGDRSTGIFQLSGPRDVTYERVGHFLAERLGADKSLVARTSVETAGLPSGIAPAHTTLDPSALAQRFGLVVPDAWAVIDATVGRMRVESR